MARCAEHVWLDGKGFLPVMIMDDCSDGGVAGLSGSKPSELPVIPRVTSLGAAQVPACRRPVSNCLIMVCSGFERQLYCSSSIFRCPECSWKTSQQMPYRTTLQRFQALIAIDNALPRCHGPDLYTQLFKVVPEDFCQTHRL